MEKDYVSSVTLIITGVELDPELVTKLMRIPASQSFRRGEKQKFASGREHTYPWSGWKLIQEEAQKQLLVTEQLAVWLDFLSLKSNSLAELLAFGASIQLNCYIHLEESAVLNFDPAMFRRLADLSVQLQLNIFSNNAFEG